MDKNKIAVVGDPSSVMIFKAVGFDVFYEQEPDQIKRGSTHWLMKGMSSFTLRKWQQVLRLMSSMNMRRRLSRLLFRFLLAASPWDLG